MCGRRCVPGGCCFRAHTLQTFSGLHIAAMNVTVQPVPLEDVCCCAWMTVLTHCRLSTATSRSGRAHVCDDPSHIRSGIGINGTYVRGVACCMPVCPAHMRAGEWYNVTVSANPPLGVLFSASAGTVKGNNKTDCSTARAVPVPVSSAVRITPCPRHNLSTWQVFQWKAPRAYPAQAVLLTATCALPGTPGTGWINERVVGHTPGDEEDIELYDAEEY